MLRPDPEEEARAAAYRDQETTRTQFVKYLGEVLQVGIRPLPEVINPMANDKQRPAHISRGNLGGSDANAPAEHEHELAPGEDIGQAEVQAEVDEETDQGFHGTAPDPTPNEAYTVQGVTHGMPTPETTPDPETTPQMRDRNPPAKETP